MRELDGIKLDVELEGCSPAEWQQTFSNWHLTFFLQRPSKVGLLLSPLQALVRKMPYANRVNRDHCKASDINS